MSRYAKVMGADVPLPTDPPPPGNSTLKITVPTVLLTALVTLLGNYLVSNKQDTTSAAVQLGALQNAEFRQEMRDSLKGIEQASKDRDSDTRNRLAVVESAQIDIRNTLADLKASVVRVNPLPSREDRLR